MIMSTDLLHGRRQIGRTGTAIRPHCTAAGDERRQIGAETNDDALGDHVLVAWSDR